jgi:hypothetical protein
VHAFAVRYYTDGTGRDSYINMTNGGFSNAYGVTNAEVNFKNSLRNSTESLRNFVKAGGFETGLSRSRSSTLLQPSLEKRSHDTFTSSQLSFYGKYM